MARFADQPDPGGAVLSPAPFHRLPGDPPAAARAFFVNAADGKRLRLALWPASEPARGTLLLFPGRTEYLEKYHEAGADFAAAGWHVLGIDWRGQGLSDRLIADPRPGHVLDFAEYLQDVSALAGAAETLDLPRPCRVVCLRRFRRRAAKPSSAMIAATVLSLTVHP